MAIQIDAEKKIFTLETDHTMYQMQADAYGVLRHLWYGAKTGCDMSYLQDYPDVGFSGNIYAAGNDRTYSLDTLPLEYAGAGVGDFRVPAVAAVHADGSSALDLRYYSHTVKPGKYGIEGLPAVYAAEDEAETLEVVLRDTASAVEVTLLYAVLPALDLVTRCARIRNLGETPVTLTKAASLCLDISRGSWEWVHFHGRHAMERQMERRLLFHGIQEIGSTRGTSSHHQNPTVLLCTPDCTETAGACIGAALVYSGSHQTRLECDQLGQVRMVMGIHPDLFRWELKAGETFSTPEVMLSYSDTGLETLSHHFHQAIREHICRGKYQLAERPVLINNWEATYFDFNVEKLLDIARSAAPLGIEMLVLDDGWFGHREDDRSSLGDWFVNTAKIGELGELVKKVNALGMKFGLWFEPEMISKDSELYRKHPEWALTVPGRTCTLSRNQMVLDMTNPAVVDYLFDTVAEILRNANIEYIKWDMNRQPAELFTATLPAEKQGEIGHRFVLGMYELKRRLLEAFPKLLIEGCSGGGGRFDAGMLYYTPQIWTSDDTDAIERVKIQSGTSLFYPASAMGAHVSAVPNHQTGRVTSFETRGNVALAGTLGYEMDLGTLNEAERELVRRQTRLYREYNDVIARGELYRLIDPFRDNDRAAWEYAAADGSEAVVTYVVCRNHPSAAPRYLRLRGLEAAARYRETETGLELAGSTLMNAGFQLPGARHDGDSWIFHFVKL